MNILIMMFLAYSIAEYIFREKLGLLVRSGILMLVLFAGLFFQEIARENFMLVPVAGLVYLCISFFEDKMPLDSNGREFWTYAFKQLAHFVAIYLIYAPFGQILQPTGYFYGSSSEVASEWGLLLLVLILNIWLAPRVIRYILNDLTYNTVKVRGGNPDEIKAHDEGAFHAGMLIGILERLLIIAAAMMTIGNTGFSVSLIGFILGTKSLARFKEFENQKFVEYFIVGTLTSVLFALISIWPLHQIF